MLNVFFACNWSTNVGLSYKLFTPKNKGIWNNIKIVDNLNDADVIVILDDVLDKDNEIYKNKKLIFVQREELTIRKINTKLIKRFKIKHELLHENMFQASTYSQFLNKTYDELLNLPYIKTKKLSCIVSNKIMTQGHKDRVKFIEALSKRFPNQIDIFGKGWRDELGENYKGELDCFHKVYGTTSKYDGLYNYEFSICIENCPEMNCFSEKINDAYLCYSTPVYFGCPNIDKYFPLESFVLIDIYDYEKSFSTIENILNGKIKPNIGTLTKAKELVMNNYNIMNMIDKFICNNYNNKKTYDEIVKF